MYKHIQHLHAPSCTFRVFPHCQGWCQDLITGQNRSRVIRVQSLVIWWWGSPFFEPYPGYPRIFFHVNIPFWGAWLCAIYIYMIMANCKWCWSLQNAEFQGPRLQSPPRWWYLARVLIALTASRLPTTAFFGSHSHSFRIGNRQGSSDPCSLTGQQQAAWKCEGYTSHVAVRDGCHRRHWSHDVAGSGHCRYWGLDTLW